MSTRIVPRRRSVRLRLTLLSAGLLTAAAAAVVTINYLVVRQRVGEPFRIEAPAEPPGAGVTRVLGPAADELRLADGRTPAQALADQRSRTLRALATQSALTVAGMGAASLALSWWLTGRVLRPLQTITATTRRLSEDDLHERLALRGPDDELKELADTIDGLLARLEAAFERERRFLASASHELRTPLAIERTLAEVALRDPDATEGSLRLALERVQGAALRNERLVEGLLALTQAQQGERGALALEPVDLVDAAERALAELAPEAAATGVRLALEAPQAGCPPVAGDAVLVERLVTNLVANAVRHNAPGGWARIVVSRAGLLVENSGPVVPPEAVEGLFEPFRRRRARTRSDRGVGLGLAIVRAVALAHGASVVARARPAGGLEVAVRFPATPAEVAPARQAVPT